MKILAFILFCLLHIILHILQFILYIILHFILHIVGPLGFDSESGPGPSHRRARAVAVFGRSGWRLSRTVPSHTRANGPAAAAMIERSDSE